MPEKKNEKIKLGTKNLAMLLSYFDYIFVHLRQKLRLRPELSRKFLSTSGPNPAQTRPEPDPKSPARLTTLDWELLIEDVDGEDASNNIEGSFKDKPVRR